MSDAAAVSRKRGRAVWIIVAAALIGCAAQLFNIQIVKGAELAEQGRAVRTSSSNPDAPRGAILDASGQVMVDTVKTYHIAVNQKNITEHRRYEDGELVGEGPADAAKLLAPILGWDPSELGGEMLGDSTYHYLAKDVDATTYRDIRRLGIYGIEWEPSFERLYPAGSTAAAVLGSVDSEGNGNGGLELVYNEVLTGIPGEESYEIGPTGAVMPGAKVTTKQPEPGATLHTTLHSDLQHSVEVALDAAVAKFGAEWGAVVVMEISTGRVLVLADSEVTDPSNGPQQSKAVQMVYEPGSVGKVLTFATALEQGVIDPYTEFTVPDRYEIEGETFRDVTDHETYMRTATGILAQSSNTGTIQVGSRVSDEDRYQTFLDLGLGSTTGIELPGESAGILHDPSEWDTRTRYTTMFGQGMAITALQSTALVAAIGNHGVWNAPTIVDGWTDADGTFHEQETKAPHQAVRSEVADTLLLMMESVAGQGGTAGLANVEGYRIAVKTGTAELIQTGGIVPSMAGVIPADDPQLAITAVLYDPALKLHSGDSIAPLFSSVATDAVRSLGISPSEETAQLFPTGAEDS